MVRRLRTIAPPPLASAMLVLAALAPGAFAQPPASPVVGSKSTQVYHDPDCNSARRLAAANRIPLAGPGAAEAAGYRACQTCRPNEAIRTASLFASAPASPTPPRARTAQDEADGPTFSADVAPVLIANCARCHNAEERRAGLDMSTFRTLMAGGESGPVIAPRNPDDSELVLRIKGESTPKMPPGNTDLAAETIARIEAWVAAGALLDPGADPNAPLADVAVSPEELRNAAMARLSPEERHAKLAEVASTRWTQAGAPGDPEMTVGERILLFGTIPEDRARRAVSTLEKAGQSIRALLSRPGKPALGNPMEISAYVFNDRNHYAEFVRTVARQEPVDGEQARADLSGEAPYLVALDPLGGGQATGGEPDAGAGRSLDGLLVEQLAAGAVASADAEAPRWLALGYGALLASKIEPRSGDFARLRAGAVRAYQIGWTTKAGEALGDVLDPEETRALAFSLLEWLSASNPRTVGPFVRGMLGGTKQLDAGIQQLFGADRNQFLAAWGQWVAARYGRGGGR